MPSHSTSTVGKHNKVTPSLLQRDAINISEHRPLRQESIGGRGKLEDMKVARIPSNPAGRNVSNFRERELARQLEQSSPKIMKITTQKRMQSMKGEGSKTENSNVDLDSSYIALNQANKESVEGGYTGYSNVQNESGHKNAIDGYGRKKSSRMR